jgi:hypothetical protein
MGEGAVTIIDTSILGNNMNNTVPNKERATIYSRVPLNTMRELNKCSTHTRPGDLSNMKSSIIEEVSDQSSISMKLH